MKNTKNTKNTKSKKNNFTIRLDGEQIKTLKEIADIQDRSVSSLIRRMINAEIERQRTKGTGIQ